MQFAVNTGPDQPVHSHNLVCAFCPLTKSMDTVLYVEEQKKSRSDSTGAHADVDPHCWHMT